MKSKKIEIFIVPWFCEVSIILPLVWLISISIRQPYLGKYGKSDPNWPIPQQNTIHWPNVCSMLGHRLRRWPNTEPTLGQCVVFAGSRPRVSPLMHGWQSAQAAISTSFHMMLTWLGRLNISVRIELAGIQTERDVVSMHGQRLRRWPCIETTSVRRLLFRH